MALNLWIRHLRSVTPWELADQGGKHISRCTLAGIFANNQLNAGVITSLAGSLWITGFFGNEVGVG